MPYLISGKSSGAKEGKKENSNGDELFVRLLAFEDDLRIDKKNECLFYQVLLQPPLPMH